MKPAVTLFATLITGALIGAGAVSLLQTPSSSSGAETSSEKQPLYWVAPMDANYRRDKPGKSPMGMDLVPVYEDDDETLSPGTVKIAPHVVNNLGVRTAPVQLAELNNAINTVGYVQYDEDKLLHIHPRVEGWIEKLFVKAEGDPVKKDAPLYTLYSPQLVNAQEEFVLALKRNDNALIAAARERLKALQLSNDFIGKLEQQRKVSQSVTFYAPQSGVIDALKTREGYFVQPGNTLMSIAQLEQVWVEAEVFERDTAVVVQGQPVSMTLDYLPGKVWQGEVDYIYPTLNPKTRTLRVRLTFDNPELLLKPNMFAQVVIHAHAQAQSDALLVPKESVIRTGKQDRVVLALGEGRFKSVAVTIGRVTANHIEILEGLEQSDEVVTSAQFLLDSESSKQSDFKRMNHDEEPDSLWMAGKVNDVMPGHRMVNISHEPAEAWGWPEMTMDFTVAQQVDINELEAGQSLHFEVTKTTDGVYRVTEIHIMDTGHNMDTQETYPTATVQGLLNSLSVEDRVLNISREAIDKWQRPAATMDFRVDEDVDITNLLPGMSILFTFEVREDLYITTIEVLAGDSSNGDSRLQNHSSHAVKGANRD
ncbi:efflux RND transporter periplasmic adaptor subunit [Planctobacterium marinum]|uniref:Hemolysin D n=1 Tax=Planctobacterium marinum TaxID=1631968 RepID=A0AA48HVD8_9ALTE|nr:hemolysin D [Planctobacterium marinum]